jgi:hypothetical protein
MQNISYFAKYVYSTPNTTSSKYHFTTTSHSLSYTFSSTVKLLSNRGNVANHYRIFADHGAVQKSYRNWSFKDTHYIYYQV